MCISCAKDFMYRDHGILRDPAVWSNGLSLFSFFFSTLETRTHTPCPLLETFGEQNITAFLDVIFYSCNFSLMFCWVVSVNFYQVKGHDRNPFKSSDLLSCLPHAHGTLTWGLHIYDPNHFKWMSSSLVTFSNFTAIGPPWDWAYD